MTGEVVVISFPFSDLSNVKNRPALVVIDGAGPDVVLAAIASRPNSPHAIPLGTADFQTGGLDHPSFIHPTKLFTCERTQIVRTVGRLTQKKQGEVAAKLTALFK
jgi:mRNA interferase MazF